MASTFTTNLNLELQATGEHSGTWGATLNTAALAIVDAAMGGVQTFSLSASNVTVTTTQSQNNAFLLTGLLTANVAIIFPSIGRTIYVANNTTGAFTVTLKTASAGATVTIPQGASGFYVLNATDVYAPTLPGVPAGAVQQFAMTTVPAGWLECDGSAISRTTYSLLFGTIGITFGVGDGSTTFNIPDLRGYFVRGWAHGGSVDSGRAFGSTQATANLAHTHTGTTGDDSPDHTHSSNSALASTSGSPGLIYSGAHSSGSSVTSNGASNKHQHPFTTGSSGGTESRPVNLALMYCIKY